MLIAFDFLSFYEYLTKYHILLNIETKTLVKLEVR